MEAANTISGLNLERVRDLVSTLPAAQHLGLQVRTLGAGTAELLQPHRAELTQHDGHLQAGVLGTLADIAAGCAAGTLLEPGWVNATVDFTVKILAPAPEDVIAFGRVVRHGRTTTVAAADLFNRSEADGGQPCVTALVTLRNLRLPRASAGPGTEPGTPTTAR